MKRLVAPIAALVLAAIAAYALLTWRSGLRESPVHGDIDPASRQRLDGVIERGASGDDGP